MSLLKATLQINTISQNRELRLRDVGQVYTARKQQNWHLNSGVSTTSTQFPSICLYYLSWFSDFPWIRGKIILDFFVSFFFHQTLNMEKEGRLIKGAHSLNSLCWNVAVHSSFSANWETHFLLRLPEFPYRVLAYNNFLDNSFC